jgi:hypothetical protein
MRKFFWHVLTLPLCLMSNIYPTIAIGPELQALCMQPSEVR